MSTATKNAVSEIATGIFFSAYLIISCDNLVSGQ